MHISPTALLFHLRLENVADDAEKIGDFVFEFFDKYGLSRWSLSVGKGRDQLDWTGPRNKSKVSHDDHFLDLGVLESLNLVRDRSFQNVSYFSHDITCDLYAVTPVAVDILSLCNPDRLRFRGQPQGRRVK